VVSLLNAYAGLAAVATGFALDNNILIVVGALDGLSGLILSLAMSKAMNRSFSNVLFGAFGAPVAGPAAAGAAGGEMTPISAEDAALRMAYADRAIIVPGYGLLSPRLSTRPANSPTWWRSAAATCASRSIPSPAACPAI
jgi:NAD(P) transhydrogenase subunit beta